MRERYLGYLSRLRYLDQSLGAFFERFFASPLADDTVVVILGDHGLGIPTVFAQPYFQKIEMRSRIPLCAHDGAISAR